MSFLFCVRNIDQIPAPAACSSAFLAATKWSMMLTGMGKMMVELCSAEIVLSVWRQRSCRAGDVSVKQSRYPSGLYLSIYYLHLQRRRALRDHCCSFSERPAGLLFSLRCNHLQSGVTLTLYLRFQSCLCNQFNKNINLNLKGMSILLDLGSH